MYIKKIRGNFGKLDNEVLSFTDGLNVIKRSNEWGKTTTVALIKAMFYGLNTSKRDKKDLLSDKTKYVASGEFNGEMIIHENNRTVNISRTKTGKSEVFNAFYEDNYTKFEYGSSDIGKYLLGVSEEAFCNSALIEVDNRMISNSDELYDLIIALSTTGDTDLNFKNATKYIKNLKTNVSKSADILALERDIANLKISLSKRDMYESEISKLEESFMQHNDIYVKKQAEYDAFCHTKSAKKIETETRSRVLTEESEKMLSNLKKEYVEISDIDSAQKAYDEFCKINELEYRYRIEIDQSKRNVESKIEEISKTKQDALNEKGKLKINEIPMIFAVITLISALTVAFIDINIPFLAYGLGLITVILSIFSLKLDKPDEFALNSKYDKVVKVLKSELLELETTHKSLINQTSEKFDAMIFASKKIGNANISCKEDSIAQINYAKSVHTRYQKALEFKDNLNFENLNEYDENPLDTEVIKKMQAELLFAKKQCEIMKREVARCEATLDTMSKTADIMKQIDDKKIKIEEASFRIKSINLAEQALNEANENLASKLSPQICKKASEYLAFITKDRYNDVILKKDFDALCKIKDGYTHLDRLKLSTGAKDQLYFSLRLAICDVLLPKETPIILDDPFVFYDDERTLLTLKLLKELSKERQILVFTCRAREEEMLQKL